jgi:hypothetical protein
MRPTFRFALLATALLVPRLARAQREGYTYISYVGPEVSLVSPADEDAAARLNMPVLPGDVLVTGAGSRAEAVLSDGNVVRLDGHSELRFEQLNRTYEVDDDRTVLALARGTVAVDVREVSTRDRALRLDTDDATVRSPARSLFRVDAGRRGTEVYVLAGRVEVNGRGGRALVQAGEYAYVSGDSEIDVDAASAPQDRFASFLAERLDRADRRGVTRYVGSDYSYDSDAADFDGNGTWTYVPSVGADCWRPNVPDGWTPYSLGTWRWTPAGLTWVSDESWGWLPYHYGTWAWDSVLGWYWIPGSLYAPAWVTWGSTSGWTGWCPTGWKGTHAAGRGWNFVPTSRLGSRLGPHDVTRGDRAPFPRGQTVVITAPPRSDRGTTRTAVARAASPAAPRPRERAASWRDVGAHAGYAGGAPAGDGLARSDEGWRASSTVRPVPVERRDGARRESQGDAGWRAPAPRVTERSDERPVTRRDDAPARREAPPSAREGPVRSDPVRSIAAPVYLAPAPAYSAPAPAPAPPPVAAPAPMQAPVAARRDG